MPEPMFYAKSGSVWYEEVDIALVNLFTANIKVKDADDNLVPVKVVIKNSNTEIKEFPCISISTYDEKFDTNRDGREDFVIATDLENGIVTMEHPAQPYNLYYQIELWAEYHLDINAMTRQFVTLIGEHCTLDLLDTEGNDRVSCMDKVDYAKLDYLDEELVKPILRRVYSYKIQVELDEKSSYQRKFASNVKIDL